jgi:hypothetical protein
MGALLWLTEREMVRKRPVARALRQMTRLLRADSAMSIMIGV